MRAASSVMILKSKLSRADKNLFYIGAGGAQGPSQNMRTDTVTEKGLTAGGSCSLSPGKA